MITHGIRTVTTCNDGGAAATVDRGPRTVPDVLQQFCTTVIVTWPVADWLRRRSACGSAGEVDPVDFDALRAAVVPGAGVVGRWPGVVCVAECADRHVLRQLLDVCAGAAGPEPGRTLARRLAMWLGGPDAPGDGLRFGTVAVTGGDGRAGGGLRGEQWAVFLYGPVGLVVPDRQVALSGAQSVAWTDRLLPRPDAPVVLALEGGPIPPGVVDGVHDLRSGVVPGAGAVLVPGSDASSGDIGQEQARNRPDDGRWPESGGPERPRWAPEPATSSAPEGLFPGGGPGNGVPSRGSLGPLDGSHGGYESAEPGTERTIGGPAGRPHLRPVPSGTNGVAHRGWVPRRGSALDVDRAPDADPRRAAGPAEDDPADAGPAARPDQVDHLDPANHVDHVDHLDPGDRLDRSHRPDPIDHVEDTDDRRPAPPGRDEPRGPESTSPAVGDDHGPDNTHPHSAHPNSGPNGARTNGTSHGLLGGPPEPAPTESERSPWSDGLGRDIGRPDRIEGWFATPRDMGTESDLGATGPADLRRPRHGRPEDDTSDTSDGGDTPGGGRNGVAAGGDPGTSPADDLTSAGGEYPSVDDFPPGGDHPPTGGAGRTDAGGFGSGSGSGSDTRAGSDFGVDGGRPQDDADDLDGSGDGTPRLGVPRPAPVPDAVPEPDPTRALPQPASDSAHEPGSDRDATARTAALRSERILGAAPGEPERPSLEDGAVTGGLVVDARQDEQQVRGYVCARGHLNDPRAQFCALCGVRMEEQAGPPAPGPRPPLGLLVFDDGAIYTVDAEYLMGRMPEADPRVMSGAIRSLALEDASGAVSRVHAQIIVNGWDALLVDAGSRNGTFVSGPGEQGWTQIPAGETHRLVPGTRVRIGGRSFLFESPSGVR